MHSIFSWIVSHPRGAVAIAALATLAMSLGLGKLEIDASTQSLFPLDDPDVVYLREVKENFGSDSFITFVVTGTTLFEDTNLRRLESLSRDLEEMEGVARVLGLFTADFVSVQDGFLRASPLLATLPHDETSRSQLHRRIADTPLVSDFLVNEAHTAIAFHLALKPGNKDQQLEKRLVGLLDEKAREIEHLSGESIDAYILGAPVIKVAASAYIWHDLVVLGPIAMLIIGGIIFGFYRSVLATLLPLLTGVLSVVSTLGFMGFAGFAINPFASVIVVLILVIGCTEDLHIMAEYILGLRSRLSRGDAIRALGRTVFKAILLTSTTTMLGFATVALNPIAGLREFAITCTFGILINFVLTLLLVPTILQFGPTADSLLGGKEPDLSRLREFLVSASLRKSRTIALATVSGVFVAIAGVVQLNIDTSYLRFFPNDSEIGETHRKFSRDFGGASTFLVTVETGTRNGVYRSDNLSAITSLHDFLESRFDHTMGLVDITRDFHRQRSGDSPLADGDSLSQLRSLFGSSLLSPFVDFDGSRTAIRVRSLIRGSQGMRDAEAAIHDFAARQLPENLEVRVTGERVLTARFSDRVTRQLVGNLGVLSLAVTVILSIFFKSVKFGLLAIIPNILPVLFTFGYMGWMGIPLSTGTFSVAIVAFGIAVDDTIHFITRYLEESKRHVSSKIILRYTFRSEIRPVLTTSAALVLGYLVLVFSPFLIHRETGILFAIAISTALLADLFVTPSLLRFASGYGSPIKSGARVRSSSFD